MTRTSKVLYVAIVATCFAVQVKPLVAQEAVGDTDGSTSGSKTEPTLTIAKVEAAVAALEADSQIADSSKATLRKKYSRATDELTIAARFAAAAEAYRAAIKTGSDRVMKFRGMLEDLPTPESISDTIETDTTTDVLRQEVASRRIRLDELTNELAQVEQELLRATARPLAISTRIPEVRRELDRIEEQLAELDSPPTEDSPSRAAERMAVEATQIRLLRESQSLEQEQLSQSIREDVLGAQQQVLRRQRENARVAVGMLADVLYQRHMESAEDARSRVDAIIASLDPEDEAAHALAVEVRPLAEEFGELVGNVREAKALHEDVSTRLQDLIDEHESIREQLELTGGGMAMVQVLHTLRSRALRVKADLRTVKHPAPGETRLASIQIRDLLRKQSDVEEALASAESDAVARLIETRLELLREMQSQYANLLRVLGELEIEKQLYFDKTDEISRYVQSQLFGFQMRSCPPVNLETVTELPSGLRWWFAGSHVREIVKTLQTVATSMPVRTIALLVFVITPLLMRNRLDEALRRNQARTILAATDRYTLTLEAVFWTMLLALPVPLLVGFVTWALNQNSAPSNWLRGLTVGLPYAAYVSSLAAFAVAICRKGGVGVVHFGWRQDALTRFGRTVLWLAVVYIPAILLTTSTGFGEASPYFDSVGRVSFLLAHLVMLILLYRLFYGAEGLLTTLVRHRPQQRLTQWRSVWSSLLLACPVALMVLACAGYLITASEWSVGLISTLALVAAGVFLHALAIRWFMIKQRRLALAEANERRRAQALSETGNQGAESAEEIVLVDAEQEVQLDWESINLQTRNLLQMLFSLATAVAVLVFWSREFPVIELIDSIKIPLTNGLSLLALFQLVLILFAGYICAKNLPGLLELAALRATSIETGTRTAILKISQYAVIAVVLLLASNVLDLDWTKFGWIAAALSVGLGFGLQEVVANFVCGLIILFEQPVRVGDVVTVDGTTGTVMNVNMRSTTIRNWDRQDFVVPNKNLITGTILNWTLSEPLNRIVIPVGVAYGSDTGQARQILLDVATENQRVLEDPAPMATFEQFADSSLNLVLRAYLPDLENRLATITELHTEIDARFKAAGIEIAFPQRDLHLRSGWTAGPPSTASGAMENGERGEQATTTPNEPARPSTSRPH